MPFTAYISVQVASLEVAVVSRSDGDFEISNTQIPEGPAIGHLKQAATGLSAQRTSAESDYCLQKVF